MTKSMVLTMRIDPELLERIKRAAKAERRSVANFCLLAIEDRLKKISEDSESLDRNFEN